MVTVYSALFHVLMVFEGREHSWITGFYWTLTVMTTLGFGDITFTSDAGRAFSIIVLLSGMVFLLILLPFTFIEFFYAPWMRAQAEARAPRQLPESASGHVILTNLDPVSNALIQKLSQYGYPYTLLVYDLDEALRLHDLGFRAFSVRTIALRLTNWCVPSGPHSSPQQATTWLIQTLPLLFVR